MRENLYLLSTQNVTTLNMKFHMCTKWDEGKSWFRVASVRMMAWVETKPSDTYPAKENNRKCNVCMYYRNYVTYLI